jgi:hypothetical protein
MPSDEHLNSQLDALQESAKTNQLIIAGLVKKTQQRHTKIMNLDWYKDGKK